jgi:hypothetical protein
LGVPHSAFCKCRFALSSNFSDPDRLKGYSSASVRLLRALSGPVDLFDAPVQRKVEGNMAVRPKTIRFLLRLRQANVATHRFNVRRSFKRRSAFECPNHFGNADIGGLRSKQFQEIILRLRSRSTGTRHNYAWKHCEEYSRIP